ncbi:MAG: YaiO family outer membrane beta-barrel protein [Prolixibacteraceae bacterium]|nr:YaiO family outer membrane beta-barrel protein [Prolixibacteraceae bacterium]
MTNTNHSLPPFIMNYQKHFLTFSLLVLLVFTGIIAKAQTYQEAKYLAYKGEREKARQVCRLILAKEYDSDVAVLMARTFAWDGKYDSSRVVIAEVLKRYPAHWDALDAISDVQYWDNKYGDAIRYCDIALTKDAKDEHFMLKKAKILNAMGDYKQAAGQLESLLQINPANAEARKKLLEIRLDQMKNRVRLSYSYDLFEKKSNKDPWQLAALSYGRKTSIGLIYGRINWADRFGSKGFQYEMDAYPHISENNYLYLNAGYSDLSIFPKVRSGAEWYHSFPKAFEGSLGMRALFFANSNTYMITGTVGKYVGNYWISLRSFVTPSSTGTSVSGSIQARRYFADPEDYIGLRLGYGVSPDDRRYGDVNSSYLKLKSQSARVEYNHLFNKIWTTNLGFSLANEEFPNLGYVLNYTFDVGVTRFF